MEKNRPRLDELCERATKRDTPQFSRFLDLSAQKEAEIAARKASAEYLLFGGAEDCERRILGVGRQIPSAEEFPIDCLRVAPKNRRFSAPLSHRDVLGTVMGLGLEREMIGDIVIREEAAYLFCVRSISPLLLEGLTRIGRSDTNCVLSEPPEGALRQTREVRLQVTSPRLDAVVAHLYRLSRGDVQNLLRQGKIAVDDLVRDKPDYQLKDGEILSVRGFGRARYVGIESLSKKGKNNLLIEIYV
ncbi:MAG: hypothetical protein IJ240_02005 [Clostridia bacterium]|nr:hypothetical protein [Clostridia bacterium]